MFALISITCVKIGMKIVYKGTNFTLNISNFSNYTSCPSEFPIQIALYNGLRDKIHQPHYMFSSFMWTPHTAIQIVQILFIELLNVRCLISYL